jgi:hypothetical protein
MSFIDKLRSIFKQARNISPAAKLLANISRQLELLTNELYAQLENVASGDRGKPDSVFDYIIMDQSGGELQTEWQDVDYITCADIKKTEGFKALNQLIEKEHLHLELLEEQIEEVDDEECVRFIVRISGWAD